MAHILVAEDEEHIRFLITKVLHTVGHTTSEAKNGLEALQMLHASPSAFDLILLDMRMPILDGFEFLDQLKAVSSPPPVVVISAHWDQIPAALQQGASGQLIKPFSRQKLVDIVNRFANDYIA
jgi:CheY-like chemotaxis protein